MQFGHMNELYGLKEKVLSKLSVDNVIFLDRDDVRKEWGVSVWVLGFGFLVD